MSFHKSIPERPHGGASPSWASTGFAAPPARSDPSGARVIPFARAPESRPAFDLTYRRRDLAGGGGSPARGSVSRRHPGELPDRDPQAGTGPAQRRARPAPGPARRGPRRQSRRHRRPATRLVPSQPLAIREGGRLADRARSIAGHAGPQRRLGPRHGRPPRYHRPAARPASPTAALGHR